MMEISQCTYQDLTNIWFWCLLGLNRERRRKDQTHNLHESRFLKTHQHGEFFGRREIHVFGTEDVVQWRTIPFDYEWMNERRPRRKVGTRSVRFYPRRMKGTLTTNWEESISEKVDETARYLLDRDLDWRISLPGHLSQKVDHFLWWICEDLCSSSRKVSLPEGLLDNPQVRRFRDFLVQLHAYKFYYPLDTINLHI